MNWQTVYVFISSTFNDMHAERDYLVKQVFPELRMWCARRKLKLVDVDLRWGVSAADAQENKRVVEVCMKNIDKCRPFFLCFMGQRRGWVPGKGDVNPQTLEMFPALRNYLGKNSVTELEILHALIKPLSSDTAPVDHARFYFRDKGYLKQIKTSAHENLFCPKKGLLSRGDGDLEHFKRDIAKKFSVTKYTCRWNPKKPSGELQGELAMGRLEDFRVGNQTLGSDVSEWLKAEIARAFPDHAPAAETASALAYELDCQDTQLFQARDGYIDRPLEEDAVMALLEDADTPVMLVSEAGCGKTSLLAHLIVRVGREQTVYYRFAGTTPGSFRSGDLASSLVRQWIDDGLLDASDGDHSPDDMAFMFANLVVKAGKAKPFTLIIDGIDQLSDTVKPGFMPETLPQGCRMLFSVRSDAGYKPGENVRIHRLGMMQDREDKAQMVKGYLSTFLKDIDDAQLEKLLSMPGSGNPLYMKIVLNELRQHGSFETLFAMLSKDYGATPLDAFCSVIGRVRRQLEDQQIPEEFCNMFFGCLACAREGMDGDMYVKAMRRIQGFDTKKISDETIKDTVYALFRELEPFLCQDGDKMILRYDSLRRAFSKCAPYYYVVAHSCLAIAFAERAMQDDIPRYMEHAMYHISLADRDFIKQYFRSVGPMIWCIRKNGAALLGQTMAYIASERDLPEFKDPARVILRAAARLDTYPETLFMELRRYGDVENPVIKGILEAESQFENNKYLVPLMQPGASALIMDEYAMKGKYIRGAEYNAPYLAVHSGDEVKVIDSNTWKIAGIIPVGLRQDPYDRFRITAGDDRLYITQWGREKLLSVKCCEIPGLGVIREWPGVGMDLPAPAAMRVVNGKLYGLFIDRQKNQGGFFESHPETPKLVCIDTGEVVFEKAFNDSCSYCFTGSHLVLRDAGTGNWYVVRTADGKVVAEDTFLGYEKVERTDMLIGGANLYAGIGKTLCIWLSGVDSINGRHAILRDVRNYAVKEDGTLELIASSDKTEADVSRLNVLSDGRILAEGQGVVTVIDEALNIMGYLDIGETTASSEEWSGRFLLSDPDTLMVFKSRMIQKISYSGLMGALTQEKIETGTNRLDAGIKDGWLYVFGDKLTRMDLINLEKQSAPGDAGYLQRACVWNMDDNQLIATTGFNGRDYSIHDLELDMPPQRMRMEALENYFLLHAFIYPNKRGTMILTNIIADKTPVFHEFKGKRETFFRCYLTEVPIGEDFGENAHMIVDLETQVMAKRPGDAKVESICFGKDAFVVFANAYHDAESLQMRVFRASNAEPVFRHVCPVKMGYLDPGDLHCYSRGLIFAYSSGGESLFGHLDLWEMRYLKDTTGRMPVKTPITGKYVCLRRGNTLDIDIYSMETYKIEKSFTLTQRSGFLVQQIVIIRDMLIVRSFNSDVLEVYDFETGRKLFDQRIELTADDMFTDPITDRLVMLDTSRRINVWEING